MALALGLLMQAVLLQEPRYDLRDKECGPEQLLIGELDGLKVYASCETANGSRVMEVTVKVEPRSDAGPLESFTIGFCESPVITATSPDGWVAEVGPNVRWRDKRQPKAASPSSGIVTLTGFSLVLKPGWMRSRSMDVQWGDNPAGTASGAGTGTTHDCPR